MHHLTESLLDIGLDGVASFQRVQNVTNIYRHCGAIKSLAGLLQCNGGKVKETEGLK